MSPASLSMAFLNSGEGTARLRLSIYAVVEFVLKGGWIAESKAHRTTSAVRSVKCFRSVRSVASLCSAASHDTTRHQHTIKSGDLTQPIARAGRSGSKVICEKDYIHWSCLNDPTCLTTFCVLKRRLLIVETFKTASTFLQGKKYKTVSTWQE